MSITRRQFIQTTAAVSIGAAAPVIAAPNAEQSTAVPEASPDLREAYDQWRAAFIDLTNAKSDMEWLVDEWRHHWPLAPEPIVQRINLSTGDPDAERDLSGKLLQRDIADFGGRFAKFAKDNHGKANFCIRSAADLEDSLAEAKARVVKGRTPRALENNRKYLARYVAGLEEQLQHARSYEAAIERVREESGVGAARRKIEAARRRVSDASEIVAGLPAVNAADLQLKAEVIVGEYERRFADPGGLGIVSDGYWLARAVLEIDARAEA